MPFHLISHRGNISGKQPHLENSPDYILEALNLGYDVEVDVWKVNDEIYFGHDEPQHLVNFNDWLVYYERLWFHCKNHEILKTFIQTNSFFGALSQSRLINFFWHETDKYTLTSKGYVWMYPGVDIIGHRSIVVLPEREGLTKHDIESEFTSGVCSDVISKFK